MVFVHYSYPFVKSASLDASWNLVIWRRNHILRFLHCSHMEIGGNVFPVVRVQSVKCDLCIGNSIHLFVPRLMRFRYIDDGG